MAYRDLLVQLDTGAETRDRTVLAAQLAGRFGAHLAGAFLRTTFPSELLSAGPYGGIPPGSLPMLAEAHEARMDKAEAALRPGFEQAAGEAAVASSWTVLNADIPAPMIGAMRRCDLTVLPCKQPEALRFNGFSTPHLTLASGGPVLAVPDAFDGLVVGKRILIAWNGSREAARALRDAAPFLIGAEYVAVVVVSPDGEGGPDGMLQRHLEHHGCKPELIVDNRADASAAGILERHVTDLGIDLVAMGLYGHPRITEFMLGGVSRRMLGGSPVPLLLSH